jgi:hypothetical protein
MNKNKVFDFDELFKFSGNFETQYDGLVLTIDNFYENPDEIYRFITKRDFPLWKYNSERNSKNGIDYNDCRITDSIAHPTRKYYADMDRVLHECRKYWHKGDYNWNNVYEFNIFQTKTVFDNKLQHYPHIDSTFNTPDRLSVLNMLVYLDKEENGGTAVYEGEWITNDERFNLLYSVENLFKIERVIPAKFNRCVIFPGNRLHGAYIDDYTKYSEDGWRISQVRFLHPC